ncbi:MAG TPA: hypothetical protein VFT16_02630 [Candidatus Saccharimonadales bacterium]|nr:hypothetical protein [Candidatus Saccharimonadales bacterium]
MPNVPKVKNQPTKPTKRIPLKIIALSAAGLVLLTGGTAAAANSSKPGDALYGIDTATERVQLALSWGDGLDESLHRNIAEERLTELRQLFEEKDVDAPGIAVALANFEEHKQAATALSKDDDDAREVENEFEKYQSEIDDLFESQQKAIEAAREDFKKQAEAAEAAGNLALATELRAKAEALDSQLQVLEAKRESSKQKQAEYKDAVETEVPDAAEVEKQHQEELQEAVKQEIEAQNEAAKKLQEQQEEAAKKQREIQEEAEKKAQEQQQEDQTPEDAE